MLPGKTTCLVEALAAAPDAALVHGTTEVVDERGAPLPEHDGGPERASFAHGAAAGHVLRARSPATARCSRLRR